MAVASPNGVAFRIESLPSLAALEADWRELESSRSGSFFTSWSWIGTLLKTLPLHIEPKLIRAERGAATVALALGVFRQTQRYRVQPIQQLHLNSTGDPNFDCITIEHNDFAGEAGLLPRFAEWFSKSDCADELIIPGTAPQNTPESTGLMRWARESPAFAHALIAATNPGQSLSRNTRQQLNRNFRSLEQLGPLSVDEAETPEIALTYFDAMKSLHIASWDRRGKRHAFAAPFFETFNRALIASGDGQLLRVRAGDTVLGYLYNFKHGTTEHAYQSGFTAALAKDRPGYVCHALAMARSAERGASLYDFLAGDNRLKRSFATSEYTLVWCTYAKPALLLHFGAAARHIANRLRGTR